MSKTDRQELRELFESDLQAVTSTALPHEKGLGLLSTLAQETINWQAQVDRLEAELSHARQEVQARLTGKIPEVMRELRMKEFTMDDGTELKIVDVYSGSISEENQPAAFKWLTKNKFGSLIKTFLSINVGRATPAQLKVLNTRIRDALKEAKIETRPTVKASVNPQTLKAFIKEQMSSGNPHEMPLDVFGARTFQLAKMIPPKGE